MNQALDRHLARLRTSYAKTPVPGFLAWWGTNLVACLPAPLRAIVGERADTLLLEPRDDALVIWREQSTGTHELASLDHAMDTQSRVLEVTRQRERIDDPALRTVLCLPADRVLRRRLQLPAAAEENLQQVLAFEMDRQTPFKADQVYFDQEVTERHRETRTISVDVVVIPRQRLDEELQRIGGSRLELDGVDVWRDQSGGARRGVNLLLPEQRMRRRNLRLPLNLGLAALALVLLFVNLSEMVSNRAAAVEAMRVEVEGSGKEAREVAALRNTLSDSLEGANFLANKKRSEPVFIAVLDDVSRRLSDDTFLERLNYESGKINLQGQSKEAANMISVLAASPYLTNPTISGQITPDPRSGKDRFQITADVLQSVPLPTGAAPRGPVPAVPDDAPADDDQPQPEEGADAQA